MKRNRAKLKLKRLVRIPGAVVGKLRQSKRFNNRSVKVGALLLACLLMGYGGGYLGTNSQRTNGSNDVRRTIVSQEGDLISQTAKDVSPSVVSITVASQGVRRTVFGSQPATQQSAGTGVIITEDGIVVTNRHVVPQGTTSVGVTLADGSQLNDVEVIGRTNDSDPLDIAFLKIKDTKGKDLKAAKLGDSAAMQAGDRVIAIGNALGQFQNTVTSGIISGYGRELEAGDGSGGSEALQNMFQTDAAINQGNSGGPLVNISGEVIGINTAVAGNAQNIGFAIPINDIQGLVKNVLAKGKLERPYIGVRYVNLTDEYAYQYNLSVKRGAYIAPTQGQTPILPDSPAAKAGLKEKDIITKVNNDSLDDKTSLVSVLGKYGVGEKVTLTVIRDGNEQKIDVTLEAVPGS